MSTGYEHLVRQEITQDDVPLCLRISHAITHDELLLWFPPCSSTLGTGASSGRAVAAVVDEGPAESGGRVVVVG